MAEIKKNRMAAVVFWMMTPLLLPLFTVIYNEIIIFLLILIELAIGEKLHFKNKLPFYIILGICIALAVFTVVLLWKAYKKHFVLDGK